MNAPSEIKQRKTATGLQRLMRTVSHDPTAARQEELRTERQPLRPQLESVADKQPPRPPANLAKPKTSLSMKKDILTSLRAEASSGPGYPCFPSVMLQITEHQFTEENVESQQAMFLLALKCDRMSLLERVGGQRVERNSLESTIQEQIDAMRSFVLKHKKECITSESREKIEKIETCLNIIHQSSNRLAAAAQSFGGLQIECKVSKSISAVMKHIASLRFNFEKNFRELNEMKNLVKQYQLIEEDSKETQLPTPAAERNFSTSLVSLRESVQSQSICEESDTQLNLEDTEELDTGLAAGMDRYQSQSSFEQKQEESFNESPVTFSRVNSVNDELNVWNLPESLSAMTRENLMLGFFIIVTVAVILFNITRL